MNKESSAQRILQDFSTVVATLLPLAQFFFISLPEGFKQIFLAQQQFIGISIITLVVSYVLMIAYQSRAWFTITLPFQGKQLAKYNEYQRIVYEASAAKKLPSNEATTKEAVDDFLKQLSQKPIKRPLQIEPNNIISYCVSVVFVSALVFVVTGLVPNAYVLLVVLQAVAYILLISFTALTLTVYYRNVQSNKRNDEGLKTKTSRAIQMAVEANCFGLVPQVRFISCFEEQGAANYHVFVEYQDKSYEIIADYRVQKLVAVYPIKT